MKETETEDVSNMPGTYTPNSNSESGEVTEASRPETIRL
jgi:hypothetical protein